MRINRRQFLAAGAGVSALTVLAACGSADNSSSSTTPRSGGTLRVGAIGKASKIEQDPHQTLSNDSDFLIASLTYDALTVPGADPNVAPRLASRWEQLPDPRRWRFTIAEGAAFHDGVPVSSADVVYSLQRLHEIAGETKVPVTSPNDIVADGPNAVILTTPAPNRDLPMLLRLVTFTVKQGTTDFAKAVGTGPFIMESFTNGNARLVRNPKWHGTPSVLDAIEVTRFEDTTAMANAVLSNQIDLASNVGAVAGRTAEGRNGFTVVRRPNDVVIPIVMRTSDGPFADPRVREALRLTVDRDAMVKQAVSGYGAVANDVLGTGDPIYDKSLPQRTRDLDKAKALLSQSNFDLTKTYQLITKDEAPGEVDSAKLFAEQAKAAGLNIDVVTQDANVFYDDTWLKAPFYTANWGTNDSVVFFASKTMYSGTKWNESGFADAAFDTAYRNALAANDDASYKAAGQELQKIQYDRGGYLVWGMADGIDIANSRVRGLPTLGGFGRVQLERAWLQS
ncbi:ABC transporter substrate-binding protein [Gordonia polyisoprenivorans]|uniref:ABC transporter substrate-binding protein n=1 Tax=Gordonia polyisoprenivorans TaxID=84595 RepID=A0A846WM19_9ACTN|nr:ABC transporter substrate-binding protein [Gordonia polyisoprenivorans]NKY01840.1 ABC transporter substrate-binding protein [Gordonia polyisoprenivorans]